MTGFLSFSRRARAAVATAPVLFAVLSGSASLLSGCAVGPNGAFQIDADELTARKLYPFQTAFGDAVLRRTLDGRYQLKFYDRMAIFDVARTDGVVVDNVSTANGQTYVTLRIPRPTCQYAYRTLLVRQKEVDRYDLPSDCQTPVSFAMEDGHLLAVQQKPVNARFWKMTDNAVVSGIVPPPAPPVSAHASPAGGGARSAASTHPRRPVRHKADRSGNSGTLAAGFDDSASADQTGDGAAAGAPGGTHHLSGVTVVAVPQKVSTAGGSSRTPIHIDLDDAH